MDYTASRAFECTQILLVNLLMCLCQVYIITVLARGCSILHYATVNIAELLARSMLIH